MADTDIIQVIAEARADAKSLSEFVFKPASFMVTRRLAPTINTLQYYVDNFERIKYESDQYLSSIPSIIDEAIANQGYVIIASFGDGATVTERNQALIDSSGNLYRWGGVLPKTVPSGATPETTGGFAKNAWVAVGDAVIEQSVDALKKSDRLGSSNYHYTQMGKAFDSKDGVGDPFASWPHENISYDKTTDKFVIFYNTNSGHSIERNSVMMRTKSAESETFSAPTIVASDKNNFSYKTQGSGIAKNGDYVSLVARFPWGSNASNATFVYRSTDKGVTFSRTEMTHAGSPITAFNGDVSGFLVTQSGRILTFGNHPSTRLCRIYYSDDNGVTWNLSTIEGSPYDDSEPAWCDLGGGKLVCLARASIVAGTVNDIIPAKFMTSMDNGTSWSSPVDSKSITNLTLSNGTLLPDYERKTVEFIHHSRRTDSDDYSSILRSWATFDEAFNDDFKPQVRVGKLAAYTALDGSTGDSGYVGAAKSKNGIINAFYYSGKRTSAQINWMVGVPNTSYNKNYDIDFRTGEKISVSTGTGSPSTTAGLIVDNHLNFEKTVGITPSTGTVLERSRIILTAPAKIEGVGDATQIVRFLMAKAVDLTDVDFIEMVYSKVPTSTPNPVTKIESLDYGLALYLGSVLIENRKALKFVSYGNVIRLDVKSLSGEHIIAPTLNNRQPNAVSVEIKEINLVGDVANIKNRPPRINEIFWKDGKGAMFSGELSEKIFGTGAVGAVDISENLLKLELTGGTVAYSDIIQTHNVKIPNNVTAIGVEYYITGTMETGDEFVLAAADTYAPTSPSGAEKARIISTTPEGNVFFTLGTPRAGDLYLNFRLRVMGSHKLTVYINNIFYYYA